MGRAKNGRGGSNGSSRNKPPSSKKAVKEPRLRQPRNLEEAHQAEVPRTINELHGRRLTEATLHEILLQGKTEAKRAAEMRKKNEAKEQKQTSTGTKEKTQNPPPKPDGMSLKLSQDNSGTATPEVPPDLEHENNAQIHFENQLLQVTIQGWDNTVNVFLPDYDEPHSSPPTNEVSKFLEKVGDQVSHFEFRCPHIVELYKYGYTMLRCWNLIREWLQMMPNVKWLSFDFMNKLMPYTYTFTEHLEHMESQARRPKLFRQTPPPKLVHLERIDWIVDDGSSDLYTLCHSLLKANPRVKVFTCMGDDKIYEKIAYYSICNVRGIEKICHYHKSSDPEEFLTIEEIQPMMKISSCMNNLKQVDFKFNCGELSINFLFQILENFPTLQDLTLLLWNVELGFEVKVTPLFLPNLQNLKLKFKPAHLGRYSEDMKYFHSLDFLLACKKLRALEWVNMMQDASYLRYFMGKRRKNENKTDFRSGFGDLTMSNVWTMFPSLKKVFVEYNEHRRGIRKEYDDKRFVRKEVKRLQCY